MNESTNEEGNCPSVSCESSALRIKGWQNRRIAASQDLRIAVGSLGS